MSGGRRILVISHNVLWLSSIYTPPIGLAVRFKMTEYYIARFSVVEFWVAIEIIIKLRQSSETEFQYLLASPCTIHATGATTPIILKLAKASATSIIWSSSDVVVVVVCDWPRRRWPARWRGAARPPTSNVNARWLRMAIWNYYKSIAIWSRLWNLSARYQKNNRKDTKSKNLIFERRFLLELLLLLLFPLTVMFNDKRTSSKSH